MKTCVICKHLIVDPGKFYEDTSEIDEEPYMWCENGGLAFAPMYDDAAAFRRAMLMARKCRRFEPDDSAPVCRMRMVHET